MQRPSRKGGSRPCQSNAATTANKKEIDERRLRKLKVYLRSVSYNGNEGMPKFPTLQDLYEDTILSEEFPCDTMKLTSRHHCAPTPFLIACCFNRRYPFNAKKRGGTPKVKTKPLNYQRMENNGSSPSRGKTVQQQDMISSGVKQTSKTTNVQYKASTPIELRKPHAASIKQVKPAEKNENAKIIEKGNCVVNGKNSEKNLNVCKNVELPTQIRDLEKWNNITTKTDKHSGGKIENCETRRKDARSHAIYHDKSSKPGKLETETGSIKLRSKDDIWTEKEESSDANEDICTGTFSTLKKNFSCDAPQTTQVENQDVTDKTSDTSNTVISQKGIRDVDQTRAYEKVEKTKISDEPVRGKEKEKSVDASRRNSLRLLTSSNKTKTIMTLHDKDKCMQKQNVKFPEKMKANISENASTRLRSRAVIKQPGHKNQHQKGHHAKEK